VIAKKLHDHIYSAGYSVDPDEAYKAFRGRAAKPGALLRKRGLADAPRGEA
jgi:peptidyl-dipeptidase Dcp